METPDAMILALDSVDAPLGEVGGKSLSLTKLVAAGMPVPQGFLLSTKAYQDFVAESELQPAILEIVQPVASEDAVAIEGASRQIQAIFAKATIPPAIEASISQAYLALDVTDPAVAVRSSATAEDLPGLSFAGQQDSYLNVRGISALVDSVRQCWASLWNARAIAYRLRMNIDHEVIAMGVVVQVMVQADTSGILFTANPTTGERSELVINASYGLGEAIVGGQVTPDTYVVDRNSLTIKESIIGPKEEMIVSASEQGTTTHPVASENRSASSLSDSEVRQLVELALQVEPVFRDVPQDIEWAMAKGKLWLLQSRAITNLPPAPLSDVSWDPPTKKTKLIRRQVVENMPDPLSPLFEELYLKVGLDGSMDEMMEYFGIPMKIEDFVERPMFLTVNGYAYCRANYRMFSWRMLWAMPRLMLWYALALPRLLKELLPRWRHERLPKYLAKIDRWKEMDLDSATDEQLLDGMRHLTVADSCYWFDVSMVLASAKVTDGMLNRFLTSWLVPGNLTSGVFLKGFPSKTLEAQQDLEHIADDILAADPLRELINNTSAKDLIEALNRSAAGQSIVAAIDSYLEKYGHQIYTLDFVEPTQGENPLPILMNLKQIVKDGGHDTAAQQEQTNHEREAKVALTLKSLAPTRRWIFQKLLGWAETYGPYREEAMFYVGSAWPTLRRLSLELGKRLVQARTLNKPDDVFYLTSEELKQAYMARDEGYACPDLKEESETRRALREARKRLHPPGMLPEGSRLKIGLVDLSFFETQKRNDDSCDVLSGFAVSPGKVTGTASVVLSPADFENMEADTILVCPTTTPAWTPLFARALALVTDIGGILAHGSIVAREYGIPAVLGTGNGTQRIVSGQRITVDGDAGTVTIGEGEIGRGGEERETRR